MLNAVKTLLPPCRCNNLVCVILENSRIGCQFKSLATGGITTRTIYGKTVGVHMHAAKADQSGRSITNAVTTEGAANTSMNAAETGASFHHKVGVEVGAENSNNKLTTLVCVEQSNGPVCKIVADASAGLRFSDSNADCHQPNSVDVVYSQYYLPYYLENALPGNESSTLSKMPGASAVCNKAVLSTQLNWLQRMFPGRFAFWPTSYNLPGDSKCPHTPHQYCL